MMKGLALQVSTQAKSDIVPIKDMATQVEVVTANSLSGPEGI
jgi:hypothetical protein